MLRFSRHLWSTAAAGTASATAAAAGDSGKRNEVVSKVKGEMWKMMKIQLALVPIIGLILIFFFPPPSAEEEKKMRIEYEQNAGWKT